MNDLISRQAAIDAVCKYCEYYYNENVIQNIKEIPSADVQPVRHGHWIHDGFDIPHGVDWMHCSECGKRDKYCPATMTNYCPNCGSRMDGEQNETD